MKKWMTAAVYLDIVGNGGVVQPGRAQVLRHCCAGSRGPGSGGDGVI